MAVPSNTTTIRQTKSLVIKGGEKAILPSNAVIKTIIMDGPVNVDYTCGTLPTPETYKCYEFIYGVDTQSSSRVGDGVVLRELQVGNTIYPLGDFDGGAGSNDVIKDKLNAVFPHPMVICFNVYNSDGGEDYNDMHIQVKMPESVAKQALLHMNMNGFYGLYLKPIEIDCP